MAAERASPPSLLRPALPPRIARPLAPAPLTRAEARAPAAVQVTIGTVEIRAVPATVPRAQPLPAAARREGAQPLALDDYLARRRP